MRMGKLIALALTACCWAPGCSRRPCSARPSQAAWTGPISQAAGRWRLPTTCPSPPGKRPCCGRPSASSARASTPAPAILGLRRSFLYRRVEDGLVTSGPYALVRHPQFLATIGMTFFATRVFQPQIYPFLGLGPGYIHSIDANWLLFTLALWVLAVREDRELAAHFPEYEAYARRVPRLFPN